MSYLQEKVSREEERGGEGRGGEGRRGEGRRGRRGTRGKEKREEGKKV